MRAVLQTGTTLLAPELLAASLTECHSTAGM